MSHSRAPAGGGIRKPEKRVPKDRARAKCTALAKRRCLDADRLLEVDEYLELPFLAVDRADPEKVPPTLTRYQYNACTELYTEDSLAEFSSTDVRKWRPMRMCRAFYFGRSLRGTDVTEAAHDEAFPPAAKWRGREGECLGQAMTGFSTCQACHDLVLWYQSRFALAQQPEFWKSRPDPIQDPIGLRFNVPASYRPVTSWPGVYDSRIVTAVRPLPSKPLQNETMIFPVCDALSKSKVHQAGNILASSTMTVRIRAKERNLKVKNAEGELIEELRPLVPEPDEYVSPDGTESTEEPSVEEQDGDDSDSASDRGGRTRADSESDADDEEQ